MAHHSRTIPHAVVTQTQKQRLETRQSRPAALRAAPPVAMSKLGPLLVLLLALLLVAAPPALLVAAGPTAAAAAAAPPACKDKNHTFFWCPCGALGPARSRPSARAFVPLPPAAPPLLPRSPLPTQVAGSGSRSSPALGWGLRADKDTKWHTAKPNCDQNCMWDCHKSCTTNCTTDN